MKSSARKLGGRLALVALVWCAPAIAQGKEPTVGLGVRVDDVLFRTSTEGTIATPDLTVNVVVPINLFGTLRIEPDLEFVRGAVSETAELSDGPIENQFERFESARTWAARIGVGAFYMWKPGPRTRIYAGGRLALVPSRSRVLLETTRKDTSETTTRTDVARQLNLQLGPNSGVEFEISPFFTIGAEGGVIVTRFGEPTTETTITPEPESEPEPDPNPGPMETMRSNGVTTDIALFIRWYFF